jgi:hypothetical protein
MIESRGAAGNRPVPMCSRADSRDADAQAARVPKITRQKFGAVLSAMSPRTFQLSPCKFLGEKKDPALMMFVQDQARQTVLSLPFFPGS